MVHMYRVGWPHSLSLTADALPGQEGTNIWAVHTGSLSQAAEFIVMITLYNGSPVGYG